MTTSSSERLHQIEIAAGKGDTETLEDLFSTHFTQSELDVALEMAVAYSMIQAAEYALFRGAQFANNNYQGVYYAVHNNEIAGLEFALSKGVDANVNNGMLINTSIMTATNQKTTAIVKCLLDHGARVELLTKDSLALIDRYGTEELKALIQQAWKLV